jgi:hypothetical protein
MRVFGSIFEPPRSLLATSTSELSHRRFVGWKPVGDDRLRTALPLHRLAQKIQCCLVVVDGVSRELASEPV